MKVPTGCHLVDGVKKRTCHPSHGRRCRRGRLVDFRHLLTDGQDSQGPVILPTTSRSRRRRAPRAVGAYWPARISALRVFFACHHQMMKTTTTHQGTAANRVLLLSHARASPHTVTSSPKSAPHLLPRLPRGGPSSESTSIASCRPAWGVGRCFEVPPSIATRPCRLRGDLPLLAGEKCLNNDPVGFPPSRNPINCPLTGFQLPPEGMLFCRPRKSVGAAGSSLSHGKRRLSWKPCGSGRARSRLVFSTRHDTVRTPLTPILSPPLIPLPSSPPPRRRRRRGRRRQILLRIPTKEEHRRRAIPSTARKCPSYASVPVSNRGQMKVQLTRIKTDILPPPPRVRLLMLNRKPLTRDHHRAPALVIRRACLLPRPVEHRP